MKTSNSYVYFALTGDNFDPQEITDRIGIQPTKSWRKGGKGEYNPNLKFSSWQLSTEKGHEYLQMNKLVDEIVTKLNGKIEIITEVKVQFQLESVLGIVLDIDIDPEKPTPSLGHDLKTIEFLHRTKTTTDIDIYRFDSRYK